MEQWHFHPPLSQASPPCSLEEGLSSPVERNKFVRQKETSESNEGVQRDSLSPRSETSVRGIQSEGWSPFSLLSFLILGFFFYKVHLEDGKREQRETLLITQKAEVKVLFELGDSSCSLLLDAVCLNPVCNFVWVHLGTKQICSNTRAGTCVAINSCSFHMFILKCKGKPEYARRLCSFHLSLSSTLSLSTA